MTAPICIDLSHHNPTPDWAKIMAAGVAGVIFKATEGTSYKDPTLYERASAAKAAGLLTGTYHFMRPGKIAEQMDWYLEVVDPVEGERMVLDHEDAGVSVGDLADAVEYLLGDRPDLQITIYSGHLIKEQLGNSRNDLLAEKTSLWIAQYTSGSPSWPKTTWPTWSLHQYTDKANVPGISAPVDGNRFNGSPESFAAWLSPAGAEPAPPPEPVPPVVDIGPVRIDIQTPPGIRVSVAVNGEVVVG